MPAGSTLPAMTVIDWLLDSDPAISWQTMRDLTGVRADVVAAERSRVAREGWGARLLARQADDGAWNGGTYFPTAEFGDPGPGQPWTATAWALSDLREFGVDPDDPAVRRAVGLVREHRTWEHAGQRFFDGEVEPCINGLTIALGAYYGEDVSGIVARLLDEQLADGGWNCEAENGSTRSSFHSTMCVIDGLLEYELATGRREATAARLAGEEYLLERRLLRRRSTGEVIEEAWASPAFPTRWHYDVLRALDHLRRSGARPDPRADEALDRLVALRGSDGRWPLPRVHEGAVHFELEPVGAPSRWITLRALRVLAWAGRLDAARV